MHLEFLKIRWSAAYLKTAKSKSAENLEVGCDIVSTTLSKIIHDWKQ